MKTISANAQSVSRKHYLVDAKGAVLGRLASQIASVLRGKHKPDFTPHVDTGDFVVVINAAQIKITGKKAEQKTYYRYTGYVGGIRETSYSQMLEKNPDRILYTAVKGMLPKGPLGRKMLTKLRVYENGKHEQQAQQPIACPYIKA